MTVAPIAMSKREYGTNGKIRNKRKKEYEALNVFLPFLFPFVPYFFRLFRTLSFASSFMRHG